MRTPKGPRGSSEERLPPLLALAADYEIVRELGRGGTAVVYLARVRETGEEVAVKLIHARYADDAEAVARFSREARFIAQLDHPNVVRVHSVLDLGDGGVALVMAHVPGRTLKQVINEDGPLAPERAERIMRDIAGALGAAHARGIVHRDVKPENIFIDEEGRALLADFGVARSMSTETQQLTMHGVAIGTPTYMAPEQIDGGELDGRGDIYSLGLVAWEMLSGRRPWDGEALYSVLYHQKHGRLTAIQELRPDVPPHLVEAIDGAIEKEREARWQSADELIAALDGNPPARRAPVVAPVSSDTIRFIRPQTAPAPVPAVPAVVAAAALPAIEPDPISSAVEPVPAFAFTPELIEAANGRVPPSRRVVAAGALVSLIALVLIISALQAWSSNSRRRSQLVQATSFPDSAPAQLAGSATGDVSQGEVLRPTAADNVASGSVAVASPAAPTTSVAGGPAASALSGPVASGPGGDARVGVPVGGWRSDGSSRLVPAPSTPVRGAPLGRTRNATVAAIPLPGPVTTVARAPEPIAAVPAPRSEARSRTRIVTGGRHTCLLAADGRGYCWGSNDRGQLGTGSTGRSSSPALIASTQRFASVAPGLSHSCALDAQGAAWCWGENGHGQLGEQTNTSRDTPTRVVGDHEFRSVVAGAAHSCGLDVNGLAWCWGANAAGQLGNGETQDRATPVAVKANRRFVSLHAGWNFTCALDVDRLATCWGDDGAGQLGDGGSANRRTPASVQGGLAFAALSAGNAHACGITTAGSTVCWGGNSGGQLGDGSTTDRSAPVRVSSENPFTTVTTGAVHSCALTAAGEAFCWGRNTYGQLGEGGTQDRSTPVRVAGEHVFASIRAFGSHTCGATVTGEAFCWGYNLDGQLGDGTRTHRTRPVYVERPDSR
jgi:serine/threonine protein kinase/alpha-tubulin suppressor-like RCC1 family protein